VLEVTGLHVAYGGIQAVRSITFHVNEGETVALIGANGAGKTSTLKAISRVLDAVGGDVHFCGEEDHPPAPHDIIRKGIALVPEGRGVFPRLTVLKTCDGRLRARRLRREVEKDLKMVFDYFPASRNARASWPAPCPAASSRCWPSAAP
jgi:branched-chain amino acid transport system ATP-binding protein